MDDTPLRHFEESGKTLVYFAAERTFLMWVRTGGSLMILGFAADRFALFLNKFSFDKGLTKGLISHPYFQAMQEDTNRVTFSMKLVNANTGESFGHIEPPFRIQEL